MPNQIEQYTAQFENTFDQVIATVGDVTDDQWRAPTSSEGWPVGVVAHHIAVVQEAFNGILKTLSNGGTHSPKSSMAEVDTINAQHARDFATVGKDEVLNRLRKSRAAGTEQMHRFDSDDLERTAGTFGGHELTVAQVMEWIFIGHAREHLESIRATVAD